MSAPRLSVAEKNAIVAAYIAGEPLKAIAARFNVDPSYPSLIARRRGLSRRHDGMKAALERAVGQKRSQVTA